MIRRTQFYIDGSWRDPISAREHKVINPASEMPCGVISMGGAADVDAAVDAASLAFQTYQFSTREERVALFRRIVEVYTRRYAEMAEAITLEIGSPAKLSRDVQAAMGIAHFNTAAEVLEGFEFEVPRGAFRLAREPIGVCALITPWNWPINQVAVKVAPALATGCTMVLKPSEVSPFSAALFADILHEAGVPKGVFNLVNGDGPTVGHALSTHPLVDLVSFTGSTRAGVAVAKAAADTVKRVHQELGGKSANILMPDADLEAAVASGVHHLMLNSGQSCNAPSRMLVPADRMDEVIDIARRAAATVSVGEPTEDVEIGPVASGAHWSKVQGLIEAGIAEGATLVAGGAGRPEGLDTGFYVKPTVFANVINDMRIAREEIFGPVLSIIGYADVEEAVSIANDTPYGLAAYIQGQDTVAIRDVSRRLRAGQVNINTTSMDMMAPFGGYKQSGNGREWGDVAFHEFLEMKAQVGYPETADAA